jgi:MYXO-CTERM domain-containing protein
VDGDCDGAELCYEDADGDGFGSATGVTSADVTCGADGVAAESTDCDDAVTSTSPGAEEACNGVDDDCDGVVDDDLADCEQEGRDKSLCGCQATAGGASGGSLAGLVAGVALLARRRRPGPGPTSPVAARGDA